MARKKHISIIVALPEEWSSVQQVFSAAGIRLTESRQERGYSGKFLRDGQEINISLTVCSQMANVAAAVTTASVLADHNPYIAIFVGICASLRPSKYRLGDVIIVDGIRSKSFRKIIDSTSDDADESDMHHFGKDGQYRLQISSPDEPKISNSTRTFIDSTFKNLGKSLDSPDIEKSITSKVKDSEKSARRPTKCHKEQIFSWDLVLDSRGFRDELIEFESKISALDMESLGFYAVLEAYEREDRFCHGVVFRGVSDYASYKFETDTGGTDWRQVAAQNAARAALEFMMTCNLDALGAEPE